MALGMSALLAGSGAAPKDGDDSKTAARPVTINGRIDKYPL
jgi:hypothetical protein